VISDVQLAERNFECFIVQLMHSIVENH